MLTSLKLEAGVNKPTHKHLVAISALMLFLVCQEKHMGCKTLIRCWGIIYIKRGANALFHKSPADANAN